MGRGGESFVCKWGGEAKALFANGEGKRAICIWETEKWEMREFMNRRVFGGNKATEDGKVMDKGMLDGLGRVG